MDEDCRIRKHSILLAIGVAASMCAPSNAQPVTPAEAVDRYLSLPAAVDAIVASGAVEEAAKDEIRSQFRSIMRDPLLARIDRWLDNVSLHGDEVHDVMVSMRNIGPKAPVEIVRLESDRVRATTDISVIESYGLGYNLSDVNELFERYPIGNVNPAEISTVVASSTDPDAIAFEVTSIKLLLFSLVEEDGFWKIEDVSETIRSATLRLR